MHIFSSAYRADYRHLLPLRFHLRMLLFKLHTVRPLLLTMIFHLRTVLFVLRTMIFHLRTLLSVLRTVLFVLRTMIFNLLSIRNYLRTMRSVLRSCSAGQNVSSEGQPASSEAASAWKEVKIRQSVPVVGQAVRQKWQVMGKYCSFFGKRNAAAGKVIY